MKESDFSPEVLAEVERQYAIVAQGTVDLLPADEFKDKLARSVRDNKPLRVKQGFDPTSPDIHIGHCVGLRKLKQFQDLGHQIVLIVGDYTAMVGDPSGQSATRPQLTYDEIKANAETYQAQFFRTLDRSKTEVVWNGDWFKKLAFLDIMALAQRYTVARLLERDDFTKRFKAGIPISIHELMYPLMQAYDSVAIKADLEIGGTDQTFNLLVGRTIQEAYGLEAQCILTLPILVGTDGVKKMSKSLGNYIGINEPPRDMFGKAMSIPDDLINEYFEMATEVDLSQLEEIRNSLKDGTVNPMEIKRRLGIAIVDMYHDPGAGQAASEEFTRMFSEGRTPDDIPEARPEDLRKLEIDPGNIYLVHLLSKLELARSNSEARKLIAAGSVKFDGEKIQDVDYEFALDRPIVVKVGKRRFLKLIPG